MSIDRLRAHYGFTRMPFGNYADGLAMPMSGASVLATRLRRSGSRRKEQSGSSRVTRGPERRRSAQPGSTGTNSCSAPPGE